MKYLIFRLLLLFTTLLIGGYWIEFDAILFSLTVLFGLISILEFFTYFIESIDPESKGKIYYGIISKALFKK